MILLNFPLIFPSLSFSHDVLLDHLMFFFLFFSCFLVIVRTGGWSIRRPQPMGLHSRGQSHSHRCHSRSPPSLPLVRRYIPKYAIPTLLCLTHFLPLSLLPSLPLHSFSLYIFTVPLTPPLPFPHPPPPFIPF